MKKIFAILLALSLCFFTAPAFAKDHRDHGKGHSHAKVEKHYPKEKIQGNSPSDPDGDENGGVDKPGYDGGYNDDRDGNNGSGNDSDCEDDNNGKGVPGHCKPKPTKTHQPKPTHPTQKPTPTKTSGPTKTHNIPSPTASSPSVPAPTVTAPSPVATQAPVVTNVTPTTKSTLPESLAYTGSNVLWLVLGGAVLVALGIFLYRRFS